MCPQCVSSLRVYRACGEPDWGAGGGPCAHSAYPPCVYRACGEPDWGAGGPCAHSAYPPCVCAERVGYACGELEEARVLTVRILPVCTERVASLTGELEARVPTVRILPRVYRACGEPDWGAGGGPCAHSAYPPCVCTERVASLTGELEEARCSQCVSSLRVCRARGEPDWGAGGGPCAHSAYPPCCVQSVWRA